MTAEALAPILAVPEFQNTSARIRRSTGRGWSEMLIGVPPLQGFEWRAIPLRRTDRRQSAINGTVQRRSGTSQLPKILVPREPAE